MRKRGMYMAGMENLSKKTWLKQLLFLDGDRVNMPDGIRKYERTTNIYNWKRAAQKPSM